MCFFWKRKKEKNNRTQEKEDAPRTPEKTLENPQYHVSQNKDEKSAHFKKWRVRKGGSNKTVKFFGTQKEAIDFAEALAKASDASVVIHKIDGEMRKQKY